MATVHAGSRPSGTHRRPLPLLPPYPLHRSPGGSHPGQRRHHVPPIKPTSRQKRLTQLLHHRKDRHAHNSHRKPSPPTASIPPAKAPPPPTRLHQKSQCPEKREVPDLVARRPIPQKCPIPLAKARIRRHQHQKEKQNKPGRQQAEHGKAREHHYPHSDKSRASIVQSKPRAGRKSIPRANSIHKTKNQRIYNGSGGRARTYDLQVCCSSFSMVYSNCRATFI